jgi:hypothetical protein
MLANARVQVKEDVDKRKEKERKREEKELRKIAKASGIKIAKPAAQDYVLPLASDQPKAETSVSTVKRSGWAPVGGVVQSATSSGERAAEPQPAPADSETMPAPGSSKSVPDQSAPSTGWKKFQMSNSRRK